MSPAVFVKRYDDPAHGDAARAHLRWLAGIDSGVLLPHLRPGNGGQLVFDRLRGRGARVADLPDLAAALGQIHGAGYARELHVARLDQPYRVPSGLAIPDFYTGRRHLLDQLGIDTSGLPTAIYKDANLRNFVVTDSGPALVDFDDLTLAPFGYDLAKLIVSVAMTFGSVSTHHIDHVLDAYNLRAEATGGPAASCTLAQLAGYAEVHYLLTARYLHRNGYRYRWPDVRPWPDPVSPRVHS